MTDVYLTKRVTTIVEHTNSNLDWEEACKKQAEVGFNIWLWFVLLFVDWEIVLAPHGTPCAVVGGNGDYPLYLYKLYDDKVYYLGPKAAPEY